ncbi:MAG: retroviral-like aspartic protease family protein [Janthinobacterium lividum]
MTRSYFTVWIALLGLVLTMSACAQSTPSPHVTTVLPFTNLPNWKSPVVELKLNDKIMGKFLVDTACNSSVLSEKMASKLGLLIQPAIRDGHPYTVGTKQARMVTLSQMQFGGFILAQPIPFIVSEKNQFSAFPQPIDGIIGINILSAFTVEFDFPRHQVTLWNTAALSDSELKDAGFAGVTAVPITESDDGTYTLPGVFSSSSSQISISLILDTGAAETSVSADIVRCLHLKPGEKQDNNTLWGQIHYTQTQVSILQIGDLKLFDLPVDYATDGDAHFPCGLGMDVLSRYQMLLDFSSKKMYLQLGQPKIKLVTPPKN